MLSTPFGDEPLEEIHLGAAPLARVIAQLRYPQLASMADEGVARAFAKSLSADYPLLEEAREFSIVVASDSISEQPRPALNPVWRLQTADGNWVVTLGQNSLSLESLSYSDKSDFCNRLIQIANTFIDVAKPPRFDRFGVRYINRVTDLEILTRIPDLIRTEMIGLAALRLPRDVSAHHGLLEVQFNRGAHTTLVRCGFLPAQTTIDAAVPAPTSESWILDIDSAIAEAQNIAFNRIAEITDLLVDRAYRFFRFTVKPDFLELFEPQG